MAIPLGLITIWSGAIVNIPAGWVLCDGNNGTPDLRSRFIVGAGLLYAPSQVGGSLDHTHTFTGDGHQHTIPAGVWIESGDNLSDVTQFSNATGTTDIRTQTPPFYALAYIMNV